VLENPVAAYRSMAGVSVRSALLVFSLLLPGLGGSPAQAGFPSGVGPSFQVNVATAGAQLAPAVARAAGGDFVVAWIDLGASSTGIKARLYSAAGEPRTAEILVSGQADFSPSVRVAMGADGGFAVAWSSSGNVYLRRFDALGQPLADARLLQSGGGASPDVVLDAGGIAVVAWVAGVVPPFADLGPQILMQRFDGADLPLGAPEQVNQVSSRTRGAPRVAVGTGGTLLVSWTDGRDAPAFYFEAWARRFDGPAGAWAPEVRLLNAGSLLEDCRGKVPILYAEGDGAVLIQTLGSNQIEALRIDTAGAVAGGAIPLGLQVPLLSNIQYSWDAATDAAGRTLVVLTDPGQWRIASRLFDRSWRLLGGDLQVSSLTVASDWQPVAAASGTGFMVAWSNGYPGFEDVPPGDGQDGSLLGVFARRLLPTECLDGSILCLDGGRFHGQVSWKNPYSGATGTGTALPLTGDTGTFWFFDPSNLELMVKVLDGRPVNGHFWVFYGSLTNVEYTLTLTDTATETVASYHNPPFQFGSRADVSAFAQVPSRTAAVTAALPASAAPSPADLVLANRFHVQVQFTDPRNGQTSAGTPVPITGDTGAFWFFDPANLELVIKVLDGRAVNGHFWVFYGALSDVSYTITVIDTVTGSSRTYHNDLHHLASRADVTAF
jgi:hypothetical protein